MTNWWINVTQPPVLILVLVELSLWEAVDTTTLKRLQFVLILVLVELSLWEAIEIAENMMNPVLILVLVELSLWDQREFIYDDTKQKS